MATSLETFVHSLDVKALPRILEIQSGFYVEDSAYEMSKNEYSLSTGDVIKITGLKIKKIIAEICEHIEGREYSQLVELPMNFPGLFKVVADKTPYHNMEEITRTTHIGIGSPCFYHQKDIKLKSLVVQQGEKIRLYSVEEINGETVVKCGLTRNHRYYTFTLPLSQEGEFYECEDEYTYTLKEIVEWKIPKSRTRTVKLTDVSDKWDLIKSFPKGFNGALILKPVYEIQCLMNSPKDIFYILSNLDIEVKDITDSYDGHAFSRFFSTQDIFEMNSKSFPIEVEIIEVLQGSQMPRSILQPGKNILIHNKYQASRILASESKSTFPKRHFLIPTSYKGKFQRRPREFPTAYDLNIARNAREPLYVVATKAFHAPHDELSSVSVGDHFLVHHLQTIEVHYEGMKKALEVLTCEKLLKNSCEAALLPLYLDGGFVEEIHDMKQYQIPTISSSFRFPFNVKVSVRDPSIKEDILASVPELQLEDAIIDSYLLISDVANSKECWEIPVNRLNMSVRILRYLSKDSESLLLKSPVEELTEEQYCMIRRYKNSFLKPPPLPPKHPSVEQRELTPMTIAEQRRLAQLQAPKD
ncbi:protein THEMIS [Sorex fumeus]|uniref:protein THEMIS n=1 Tax=Sorex fumeus TaxID=62283 RepID=UPI0024ADD924|nr:protein THEMIS [Sorex fumeus]